MIQGFYIENMLSDSPKALAYSNPEAKAYRPALCRFRLPQLPTKPNAKPMKAVSEFKGRNGESPELPTINNAFGTSKHRYIYGVKDTGRSTFLDGLIKHDAQTRTNIFWNAPGQTPGEPIFMADPESTEEDGGIVLSVMLDGLTGKSYLLILNAKEFREIGGANVDVVVGFGFHGTHAPQRIVNEGQPVSSGL